ncbi:MAG: zeta toxin family protein, partial [Candidatus Bipolaricaulota bacterium]
MSQNVAIIGIAGGTGAGKTVLAEALADKLGKEEVVVLPQDAYYKDRSHIPPEERQKINYDHPDSFENDLLVDHLEKLSDWDSIERPVYNFTTHTREESITVQP